MFRVLWRELILSLGALTALAVAALALAAQFGPPALPDGHALWLVVSGDAVQRVGALSALGTTLRVASDGLLALLAGLIVLRIVVAGLLLLRLDYAILAHLAVAVRLPVMRRAGATAAVGLLLAPVGSGASGLPSLRRALALPARLTAIRHPVSGDSRDAAHHAHAQSQRQPPKTVFKPAGPALRYTVQPGDTLSLIAERLCGDARRYTAIFRASHTLRQPDGRYLTNPNVIYPGWTLLVPLRVVTALHLSGAHVIYVVQPGDSLSAIAARFLGDWRRYPELQPVGTTISNANLIDPGLVLRLPAGAIMTPYTAPAHLRRIRPRRAVNRQASRGHAVMAPHPATATATPHIQPPTIVVVCAPLPALARPIRVAPTTRHRHHTAGRHAVVRPKRHVRPRRRRQVQPTAPPIAPTPTVAVHATAAPPVATPPTLLAPPHHPHEPPSRPVAFPPVYLPDMGRSWPLPLLLTLAPLFVLVALKRRRIAAAVQVIPTVTGTRLVPSMRRAIEAVHGDMRGQLARATAMGASMGEVNVVVPIATALQAAGVTAGLAASLAATISTVTETAEMVCLTLDARGLSGELAESVTRAMSAALQSPVRCEPLMEADGPPWSRLTVRRARIAALVRDAGPDTATPHPAPLLVPLGETRDGAVVHLHLGRLSPLLIAGGARGTNTLVATLLAGVLAQAAPDELRLLVSSNDDELRGLLPALEHLESPPADADDVAASARIVAQAHRVVLERFTAGDAGATRPAYLVVLDNVENLRADPRALDHLDAVCRNGRVCGVHVVATTSDIVALAEAGVLEAFGARMARPLRAEESRLLWGDDTQGSDSDEMLLRMNPAAEVMRLFPYTLTLPEVREALAHVVVAYALDDQATPPQPPTEVETEHDTSHDGLPSDVWETGLPTSTPRARDTDAARMPEGHAGTAALAIEPGAAPALDEERAVLDGHDMTTRSTPETVDASVELRVFGGIAVVARGEPVVLQPREQRLLAALAVMGPKPVHPDRLVESLFPDDDPLIGQDKLQHSITDIRLVLKKANVPVKRAGVVRYTAGGYILDQALVRVDAHRFRDVLRRAEIAERRNRFALLSQAIQIYIGDLCGDQALDWVEGYRYAWRKEYLEALYEIALHYEQEEQDHLGALRVARRLAAEEPLQDHYHQMVLELIATTSDINALDGYAEEMRAVYARHDTEIDGYTHALLERLRARLAREHTAPDGSTKAG